MCRIVGVFAYGKPGRVTAPVIERMRDTMAIAAPTAAAFGFRHSAHVGLGHRRLSFIDLSDRAASR